MKAWYSHTRTICSIIDYHRLFVQYLNLCHLSAAFTVSSLLWAAADLEGGLSFRFVCWQIIKKLFIQSRKKENQEYIFIPTYLGLGPAPSFSPERDLIYQIHTAKSIENCKFNYFSILNKLVWGFFPVGLFCVWGIHIFIALRYVYGDYLLGVGKHIWWVPNRGGGTYMVATFKHKGFESEKAKKKYF